MLGLFGDMLDKQVGDFVLLVEELWQRDDATLHHQLGQLDPFLGSVQNYPFLNCFLKIRLVLSLTLFIAMCDTMEDVNVDF